MGYKATIQLLKQAEDLKSNVLKKSDLLNDTEAWTNQQMLQHLYQQVLLLDLEYALDKKAEQDLWNIGFKKHIGELQEKARDKKSRQRSDYQALLTWALEAASGFYLTLLQEFCNAFDIDFPFRRRGIVFGQTISTEQVNVPQIASSSYICQYCLVHLGDIARYRNQRKQAENFYKQAILVSPHSGHPYNQLALLEASQGDKLSTVFYYIRGICVKNPFPASTTNLMNVLTAAIDKESPLEKIHTKLTVNEFIQLFLCAHGYFQTASELEQAQLAVTSLNTVMTALVATQSFKKEELIKMTIINLYALSQLAKDDELTKDEQKTKNLILQLVAGSLSAFLIPVYTLQNDKDLLDYYALPAVKLLMYFLHDNPAILQEKVFKERMQIWPSLCKLVNSAQILMVGFNYNKFSKCSLQEDRDIQGYLPLDGSLKHFSFKVDIEDTEIESKVRLGRILEFAKWLCDFDINGSKLIAKSDDKGGSTFEAVLSQPDPTNDLLEEMKSLTVQDKSNIERKGGILKPQGSLEKSREEKKKTEVVESVQKNPEIVRPMRGKQNVALQSIFKKIEQENKQVKFNVAEQEKSVKFDQPTQPVPNQSTNQFLNPPNIRPQTFNPTFSNTKQQQPQNPPPPPPPTDYLTNLRNLGKGADHMMPQFSKNSPYSNIGPSSNQQPSFPPSQFNVPPPPSPYNNWNNSNNMKMPPPNNWWPQNQSYQYGQPPPPPPNFPNQFPQTNFPPHRTEVQNYPSFQPYHQQFKPPQNNIQEMYSPWEMNRGGSFEEMTRNSISMRQAMLKEVGRPTGNMPQDVQQNAGYSLFNNSWAPSLPNQLRGNMPDASQLFNGPQHSLFGGPGPQSLAQLLEHQQNQMGPPNVRNDSDRNQDS